LGITSKRERSREGEEKRDGRETDGGIGSNISVYKRIAVKREKGGGQRIEDKTVLNKEI
jgi:hypothetical protein